MIGDQFEVGDEVVVRDWDDMAEEFRIDGDGDIFIVDEEIYFVKSMSHYCGQNAVITEVHTMDGVCDSFRLDIDGNWTFSPGMLVRADHSNEPQCDVDIDQFIRVLMGGVVT